jgi:hypothetical protein
MRLTILFFLIVLAGCPYKPDLAKEPFLCNTTEPACPHGYNCQADEQGVMVCVQNGLLAIPDALPVNCADDHAMEPNDTIETAYVTPLEDSLIHISYSGLSICPGTDVDTYQVDVAAEGHSIDVVLTYEPGFPLTDALFDLNSAKVADGAPGGDNVVRLHYAATNSGAYYIQVTSPTGHENNYRLDITTTP